MDPDLIRGARAIGEWIDRSERATYHLLDKRLIPAFQIGGIWYARKSTLSKFYSTLEQSGDAA
jgi:hypothetical protein